MSYSNIISVCIPAHNEEQSIALTLNSVRDAMGYLSGYEVELLICANACIDDTVPKIKDWAINNDFDFRIYNLDIEELIEEIRGKDKGNLTLLITKIPGKPNALNNLCTFARGDILVFIDADVIIHPKAFVLLIQKLFNNPEIKGAGGIVLAPDAKEFNLLYRRMAIKMKEFATKLIPYLNGPLYAVRKNSVKPIPDEIIADDAYITMAIGVKNIS
jgi:glycosyltransferase involved in cell wall biosynthesis